MPLWKGGADDIDNATALCATCHAQKTQRENIERAEARAEAVREEVARRRAENEERIWKEENARQVVISRPGGRMHCETCDTSYFSIFPHKCSVVARRVRDRLREMDNAEEPKAKRKRSMEARREEPILTPTQEARENPFACYVFLKPH